MPFRLFILVSLNHIHICACFINVRKFTQNNICTTFNLTMGKSARCILCLLRIRLLVESHNMFVAKLKPVASLELLDVSDVVAVVCIRSNVHQNPG